jgi:hypothetical protein
MSLIRSPACLFQANSPSDYANTNASMENAPMEKPMDMIVQRIWKKDLTSIFA